MTPKFYYFEQIEEYNQELLDPVAKLQFETELKVNPELRIEVKLREEIQLAITEQDVKNLRDTLKNVDSQNKIANKNDDTFELLNEFSDIQQINNELSSEELINFFDSMPKVHVHQHENTTNENIHQFYKEQNATKVNGDREYADDSDLQEFEGLEEAVLEKDIFNLRQTLTQISKTIDPQFSVEEIDNFLNDELTEIELEDFENEFSKNEELQRDVQLHKELDRAVRENDIMDLRNQITQIMETETSWNVSEQNIEDFIDGELEGDLLENFNNELKENSDLIAEVELRRQVNDVIGEQDIRELRAELKDARELAEMDKVRKLIPVTDNKLFKTLRASVAVAIFVIGVGGVLNNEYLSVENTYNKFFEMPTWSAERSVSANLSLLQSAHNMFLSGDYNGVIGLEKSIPIPTRNNPVFQFYSGASLQKLNRYKDAIAAYTNVINQGDNLFIEEAEWYRSLCYMKIGDKLEAKQELLAVINRKGHYEQDAKAIIRRLKFTFE